MFMPNKNLGITDFAVSRAIMELHEEHDLINAQMIADKINGEETAVYRSLKNLKEAGLVSVCGGSRRAGGYRYEYTGE